MKSMSYFCTPNNEGTTVDFVAQLVEQYTFNVWALGSSPSGITKTSAKAGVFLCTASPAVFFIFPVQFFRK